MLKFMNKQIFLLIQTFFAFLFFQCSTNELTEGYRSENLEIYPITESTFIHVSYLQTQDFGKVACNGLIFVSEGEAIVFDTPTNDSVSHELINWVEQQLHCKIKAVVATHFHGDCLGGLTAFHEGGIASYANDLTIELAKEDNEIVPQNGFNNQQKIQIGKEEVICKFLGEGHTADNIVGYIPSEKVLFGGCLIKELNANEGFTGDANLNEWSNTVSNVKSEFNDVAFVVPGHGKYGDVRLLDYTIELFGQQ
jgi:metallo-beta-lactamase class B